MLKLVFLDKKEKKIDTNGANFSIEAHGVRYTDPETGMIFVATYDKLARVELEMEVTEQQIKYAKAFQIAHSDSNPVRGVSPLEQIKREQDIKAARAKLNTELRAVTKALVKKEGGGVELPMPVVHTIRGCATVEEAVSTIELDYPDLEINRDQVRSIIRQQRMEDEADEHTINPGSVDLLLGTIDRGLYKEIARLTRRVTLLSKIAEEKPNTAWDVPDTGETLTPEDAREELVSHRATLLELKKAFVDQKKAEAAMKDTGVNVNVDLGNVMGAALDNIRSMEIPTEARVVGEA